MKEFKNFSKYKVLSALSRDDDTVPIDELVDMNNDDYYKYTLTILRMTNYNARVIYKDKKQISRAMNTALIKRNIRSMKHIYVHKRLPLNKLVKRRF